MNYYKQSTKMVLRATIVALTAVIMVAGQGNATVGTCAVSLTGCLDYINGTTTPPPTCCTPLKDAVTTQKQCLCDLYANPSLLTSFGVNVTQALNLPLRCKIQSDSHPADFCKGVVAPSGSPSSSSKSPPTGSGSGSGSNSAVTVTGTGIVSTLLLFITYALML